MVCNHSTDIYGQGPFYTTMSYIVNNQLMLMLMNLVQRLLLVVKYLILNVQKLFQIQKLIFINKDSKDFMIIQDII